MFDMIKQKVFLLPQNSHRINNLHIALVTALLLYNDIYSKYCSFKTRFVFCFTNSFALSRINKVTIGTSHFVSVTANVGT